MKPVFLDTAGLVAIWNEDDQWHVSASAVFADLVRARTKLITTDFVLLECGNAASRRPFRSNVISLRNGLKAGRLLIAATIEDQQRAWEAFERGEAGGAGIVDLVSFQVMRRLGLTRAFTGDAHFRAAGFETMF